MYSFADLLWCWIALASVLVIGVGLVTVATIGGLLVACFRDHVRRWHQYTTRRVLLFTLLVGLGASGEASAQFATGDVEQNLRAMLPDRELAAEPRLLLYTEDQQPKVYQFSFNHTGLMSFCDAYYNTSMAKRENPPEPYGNPNFDFPWGGPGGAHRCTNVASFKFLLLPQDPSGNQKPIVWYTGRAGDEMHVPSIGFNWIYPRGALVGEVLLIRSPDGQLYPFEMRTRERAERHWEPTVRCPFPTANHLAAAVKLVRPDWQQRGDLVRLVRHCEEDRRLPIGTLVDQHPDRQGFYSEAEIDELPAIDDVETVKRLLTEFKFDDATGQTWRGERCHAPTTKAPFHVVPANYDGGFIPRNTQGCAKCHESVGLHARDFDRGRDWYGRIRGGDRIFSCSLHDPACIDPTHFGRPPRMLNIDGLVVKFDPARHSRDDYLEIKE